MDDRHHKRWTRWANRGLLALEGILTGAACAFVICLFRLSRDKAAPLIASWLGSFREH